MVLALRRRSVVVLVCGSLLLGELITDLKLIIGMERKKGRGEGRKDPEKSEERKDNHSRGSSEMEEN